MGPQSPHHIGSFCALPKHYITTVFRFRSPSSTMGQKAYDPFAYCSTLPRAGSRTSQETPPSTLVSKTKCNCLTFSLHRSRNNLRQPRSEVEDSPIFHEKGDFVGLL